MENTIVTIFVILALALGFVAGAVIIPGETKTEIEYQDKIVEKVVNVTVEKLVEIPAPDMLSLAVDAFLIAVEDEDVLDDDNEVDVLSDYTNASYRFSEMEVNRVYDDWSVSYVDDKTIVDFNIKLRFDEDDEPSERVRFDVTVTFEEDEDTIVEVVED